MCENMYNMNLQVPNTTDQGIETHLNQNSALVITGIAHYV